MPVLLEERVAVAVERVLEQENGRVAVLIEAAIDKQLADLVAAELAARAEALDDLGRRSPSQPPTSDDVQTKVCRRCGESKPVSVFDKNRATCRACRWQQHRAREARSEATGGPDSGSDDLPQPPS